MGTEQPEPAEQDLIEQYLLDMALDYIGPALAQHACVAPPAVIVEALKVAGVDIILRRALAPGSSSEAPKPEVPHETPGRRYSVRANPTIADGAMETLSFRIPTSIKRVFEARVAELKDLEDEPGITNATDAGQDAIVKWCLMEGK